MPMLSEVRIKKAMIEPILLNPNSRAILHHQTLLPKTAII